MEDHKWATKRTEGWSDQRLHRRAKRKASTKKNGMRRTRCTPTPRSTKVIGTSTSTSNTMNHTTRITDWTCDRSRRAARRDVRFYHVGVPQIKKTVYFYYSYFSFLGSPLILSVCFAVPRSRRRSSKSSKKVVFQKVSNGNFYFLPLHENIFSPGATFGRRAQSATLLLSSDSGRMAK